MGDEGKRLGRGRWVGRGLRQLRCGPGSRLVTLPFSSRHVTGCLLLLVETEQPWFHQLNGSTSVHCSHEHVRLGLFSASLG